MSDNAVSNAGVLPQTFHFKGKGRKQTHFYIIIARSVRILCEMFSEIIKTQSDILCSAIRESLLTESTCLFVQTKDFFFPSSYN